MNKVYIGLIGKPGSGKETFAKLLAPYVTFERNVHSGIGHHRFSDVLYEILKEKLSLPADRVNAQRLAVGIKNELGTEALTNAVKQRIIHDDHTVVILDGIRWPQDELMLRELPNNLLLYIHADQRVRFERMKARKEKKKEEFLTWPEFLTQDVAETERFIEEIAKKADYPPFQNNGTIDELKRQISDFCRAKLFPLLDS